jgi:hypothetical protein
VQALVREGRLRQLVATDAASEGLNLQRLSTLINIDRPWNPARLEQRKGRIDRIGQMAGTIEVLNLRYRGSVEDDVHKALSGRLQAIRDVFGTVPDTLEDVWVLTALGNAEDAKRRIEEVPAQHPFQLRYANNVPVSAWERCTQVLDKQDVAWALKQGLVSALLSFLRNPWTGIPSASRTPGAPAARAHERLLYARGALAASVPATAAKRERGICQRHLSCGPARLVSR